MKVAPGPSAESAHEADARGTSGRLPLWGGLASAAAVFAYSWCGDHVNHPADDAGITLRYAERIARGLGFDYNDGEAVHGASNPLHTLVEAALLRAGLAPGTVVLGIASVCLALTAGVLFSTFARFYSRAAAVFAVVALVAFPMPFESVTDGMETPLVVLLPALLFRALHTRGELYPGLVLGCLVANKLDGALAAIAYAAVFVASRRRLPWRAAGIALLAASPVFLALLASFGSIVPNSMIVKLTVHSRSFRLDPLWMHRLLLGGVSTLYVGALASLLWGILARELQRSFAIVVIQAWFVLHLVTFATVNMGGPFHWYAAAPEIQSVILSSFVVHSLASARFVRGRWPRLDWDPLDLPWRTWPVVLALLGVLARSRGRDLVARVRPASPRRALPMGTSWDLARQSAGAWLRLHTSRTELFATFEGLPSYEYEGPVYDFSLLNSRQDEDRRREAAYLLTGPLDADAPDPPAEKGHRKLVASFRYDAKLGLYLLYARPESEAWRNGARSIEFQTPALWSGRPDEGQGFRLPQRDNTWVLPADGRGFFSVRAWAPPAVMFTPRLVRPPGAREEPGTRVRLRIVCAGVELASVEVATGVPPIPIRVDAPRREERGQYTFEIECRPVDPDAPGSGSLELAEILVRSGEPLRAGDFKLTFEADRELIEHAANAGLPCGGFVR